MSAAPKEYLAYERALALRDRVVGGYIAMGNGPTPPAPRRGINERGLARMRRADALVHGRAVKWAQAVGIEDAEGFARGLD